MKLTANAVMIALSVSHLCAAGNKIADCGSEIRMRVLDGRPVIDCVYLNGQGPYRFLVDTGTQINLVESSLARKAGLKPTFAANVASPLGTTSVSGTEGIEVAIGAAKAAGQRFLFSDMEDIQRFSRGIQGLLGQEFLSHFDYLLDFAKARLTFGAVNMEGTHLPLAMTHGVPSVATSLGVLLLDSGAGQLVLFGAGDGTRRISTASGFAYMGSSAGGELVIAGRTVQYGKALTVLRKNEKVDAAGLLPVRLFQAVYVCNSEGYLVLN
jgi:hypothetical protein